MASQRVKRLLAAAACALLLGPPPSPGDAMTPASVQNWFDGRWSDGTLSLIIDVARLQANVVPDKPFQWEAFKILNISGSMVVFDIGSRRYLAMMEQQASMTLTGVGVTGQHKLYRRSLAETSR